MVTQKNHLVKMEIRSSRGRDREESRMKRLNRPDPRWWWWWWWRWWWWWWRWWLWQEWWYYCWTMRNSFMEEENLRKSLIIMCLKGQRIWLRRGPQVLQVQKGLQENLFRNKMLSAAVKTSPDVKDFLLQYGHFGAECDNGPELDRCYRCRSTAHIARWALSILL